MQDNPQERGQHTSASSAHADALCAGRHLAQRGLPDIKDESATHGTAIHAALAKQDPLGLTLEQEEIYDACLKIEAKLVQQWFGDNPPLAAIRETRFWIEWGDKLEHSAQLDCLYVIGKKALIIEYKTLQGQVGASPSNLQLRDQVCVLDGHTPFGLEQVAVAVVQPLVTHTPEMTVYGELDIARACEELHARVIASNKPDAPRTPGEIQCKWCRCAKAGTCKEYNAWAAATIIADRPILATVPADWTPAMCVRFLEHLPVAQKWLDDCKDEMKRRLKENPSAIPGYTLGKPKQLETITNPQAVFDSFSQSGGTLEQFMDCIKVGKTALKEGIAAVTKLKGKALDEKLKSVIGANSETKESEPSIVKDK